MTTASSLTTSAERLGKDRVKLRVQVPEATLEPAVAAAYRRWAREIKVPGFRKGKVPRQIIDARVGTDTIRQEALRDALPDLYGEALRAEDLEAIAPPEIEVVEFEAGAPLIFEATVDVRPEVVLPDLSAITVEAPPYEVSDADVDEHLERLRDRFAELETVHRELRRGDFALIDLTGTHHGEPVEGAGAPDLLYEVGSRTGPPSLDDELEGSRPGSILKFTDTMPEGHALAGRDISFTVLVKEVRAKMLPPLDDDFARTVGEFDSLDELRAELRERFADIKRSLAEDELRIKVAAALVDASELDPPQRLVEQEFEHRLQHLEADLAKAGSSLEDYGRRQQLTELEIRRDVRREAARAVTAELVLEQIARDFEVEVAREEIGREIGLLAARMNQDPSELAGRLAASGQVSSIAADIMRRKALDVVVERVNVIGRPADPAGGSVGDDEAGDRSGDRDDE